MSNKFCVFYFMEGISSNKSYNRIEYCIFTSSDFIRTKDSTHWHTLQKRCYFPEKKIKLVGEKLKNPR